MGSTRQQRRTREENVFIVSMDFRIANAIHSCLPMQQTMPLEGRAAHPLRKNQSSTNVPSATNIFNKSCSQQSAFRFNQYIFKIDKVESQIGDS
jgi:hypothetical protein